jgi:hypothetical protein
MKFVQRLVTGRAALLALVGAALVAARRFGVVLPAGAEGDVSKVIDTALSFLGFMVAGSYLHTETPPEGS